MAGLSGLEVGRSHAAIASITGGKQCNQELTNRIGVADSTSVAARIRIRETNDLVKARQIGRLLAQGIDFSDSRVTLVTMAISELARNIILYAKTGEVVLSRSYTNSDQAVVVEALDQGPGIVNLQRALAGGFSTSGSLGLGLSGLKHLVDHLEISSQPGEGTRIIALIRSR